MVFRSALAILVAAALSGCGSGVDDLSLPPTILVTLRGHVDVTRVQAAAGGHPLNAALVWGADPSPLYQLYALCLKYASNADLQPACPDPFGFVPSQIEATTRVNADGSFDLPLIHLPDARVCVGTAPPLVAWGSLVVAADTDGSGTFDFFAPRKQGEYGRTPPTLADRVVAASFWSLQKPEQRVGYLEGTWNEAILGLFYPLPGCPTPRAGFSVLTAPGMTVDVSQGNLTPKPLPGTCTDEVATETVEATPLSGPDGRAFACRQVQDRLRVSQPPMTRPGINPVTGKPEKNSPEANDKQACLDATTLALISPGDCPTVQLYPLKGCGDQLSCQTPEWDLTKHVPVWWPCH